jgi:ABC-2 type transport system ATP-binding protein
LDYYGTLYGRTDSQRKGSNEYYLKMLGLWEKRDALAGALSKGTRQRLAVARALVHDPRVLFMDEPTANLDPESSRTVRDLVLDLRREGRTILLNTHNLDEAQRICDRIAILNTKLMALGSPEELERSVSGRRKTVVELEEASDAVGPALRMLPVGDVTVDGRKVAIDVKDPDKENAAIIDAIVRAGGRIRTVSVVGSSLEDAYLKLVRRGG